MAAILTSTRYFSDIDIMVDELLNGVPNDLGANDIAFLSTASEANYRTLVPMLASRLPCTLVGGTTLNSPFHSRDCEVGAYMTVVRGIRHALAVSEPLVETDGRGQMERLYRDCVSRLGDAPKVFFPIMPVIPNLTANYYMPHLFELAGDIPVFGGMVSDDFDSDKFAVFAGRDCYPDRIALLALGGDIEPVFGSGCDVTILSRYRPTVTEASGNVVSRVDDMSFCEYLTKLGFHDDVRLISDFPLCVIIYGGLSDRDGIPEISHLVQTDPAKGTGTFSSEIPMGRNIAVGFLTKDNIDASTRKCIDEIGTKIESRKRDGYNFSLVFCVSCVGRYFALVGQDNSEGEMVTAAFNGKIPLFGYYGFNEICPVPGLQGEFFNRPLSDSIVMCAL